MKREEEEEEEKYFYILIWLILMCRYLNLENLLYIEERKKTATKKQQK